MDEATDTVTQWQEFRQAREAELAQPFGWLTIEAFHWLTEQPSELPGLPGRWSTDGIDAFHDSDQGHDTGHGRDTKTVAETSRVPWFTDGDREVELLRRGGRMAVRVRTATSPQREAFTGVPTYDYDPAYVVTAIFHPYADGTTVDVATHRPELRQVLPALGEVEFTLAGEPQRLVVTNIKTGPSVEFHDPTNGTETPAWRQLKFERPGADGQVVLDFNRTIDMWFAFTDHATCPQPVEGNRISVPVRAGEKNPA